MMMSSYYLNDIALILKDLEKQDKRLEEQGHSGIVFVDGPVVLTDEGGGKVGEIRRIDDAYWFIPDPDTFKDIVDLDDPTALLPHGSTGKVLT
jgi:hypothetical protein